MRHLQILIALVTLLVSPAALAANEIRVVFDTGSGQELKTATWDQLETLASHRRVIAVYVVKDIAGGPFWDVYTGIDALSLEVDSGGHLIARKYTSSQGGKLRVQQTNAVSGALSSERTVDNASELVIQSSSVAWDFHPNPSQSDLDDACVLAGAPGC